MSNSKQTNPQARRWVFTMYEMEMYEQLKHCFSKAGVNIRFMCYQGETAPSTGRDHIQGYVEFPKVMRRSGVRKLFKQADGTLYHKFWMEPAAGKVDHNIRYCTKNASSLDKYPPVILGEPAKKSQGKRTDLGAVAELILNGSTVDQVAEILPTHYIKFHKGIEKLAAIQQVKLRGTYVPNMTVNVLYGDAGSGKTRRVFDNHGPQNCFTPIWSGSKFWFNGYTNQKVLLINEFYGQCRTSTLQELLDKYRLPIETKGGIVTSQWDTIYITSNCHPKDWYRSWENIPTKVEKSIIRRISTITYLKNPKIKDLNWDAIPKLDEVPTDCKSVLLPSSSVPKMFLSKKSVKVVENAVTLLLSQSTTSVTILPSVPKISVTSVTNSGLLKPVYHPMPVWAKHLVEPNDLPNLHNNLEWFGKSDPNAI